MARIGKGEQIPSDVTQAAEAADFSPPDFYSGRTLPGKRPVVEGHYGGSARQALKSMNTERQTDVARKPLGQRILESLGIK